jgi:DNA segregation ATPase FtsK/SpoIIIE-like protein
MVIRQSDDYPNSIDCRLNQAIDVARKTGSVSVSKLQRALHIGYARAGHMIDEMKNLGIIIKGDPRGQTWILTSDYSNFQTED